MRYQRLASRQPLLQATGQSRRVTVMVRFLVIILYCILAVVPSGCLHRPRSSGSARGGGEVYLYLQPFPRKRSGSVRSDRISALRGDGARFPCSLNLGSIKADEMRRQRYAASCRLEPGAYAGFRYRPGGRPPDRRGGSLPAGSGAATALDAPFQIRKKKAQALFLSLNYPRKRSRTEFQFPAGISRSWRLPGRSPRSEVLDEH